MGCWRSLGEVVGVVGERFRMRGEVFEGGVRFVWEGLWRCVVWIGGKAGLEVLHVGFWGVGEEEGGRFAESEYEVFRVLTERGCAAARYFWRRELEALDAFFGLAVCFFGCFCFCWVGLGSHIRFLIGFFFLLDLGCLCRNGLQDMGMFFRIVDRMVTGWLMIFVVRLIFPRVFMLLLLRVLRDIQDLSPSERIPCLQRKVMLNLFINKYRMYSRSEGSMLFDPL